MKRISSLFRDTNREMSCNTVLYHAEKLYQTKHQEKNSFLVKDALKETVNHLPLKCKIFPYTHL